MDAAARTPRTHVVCFEEAGDCTLEHIARDAADGDTVLALGPEAFALRLRAFGLREQVGIESIGRAVGGRYRTGRHGAAATGAAAILAYGRRAADAVPSARPAPLPDSLPAAPGWSVERRTRVRREIGLAPGDFAVLLAADPAEWIDLSFACRAAAMARVAGAPLRLVVSPRVPRIERSSDFLAQASGGGEIVRDPRAERPWELLPALDASIHDADGAVHQPVECAGWRMLPIDRASSMSPLPALWSLACAKPALVHRAIELGSHASHPLVDRFDDGSVAELARALHARATSASAASR